MVNQQPLFAKYILLFWASSCLLMLALTAIANTTVSDGRPIALSAPFGPLSSNTDDWLTAVPIDQQLATTTTDWITASNNVCSGYYQVPQLIDTNTQQIQADSGAFSAAGKSTLTGNVVLKQPAQQLFANTMVLFRDANSQEVVQADAIGQVLFERTDARIAGSYAYFNLNNNLGIIYRADYRFYNAHARGTAQYVNYQQHQPYHLSKASYTTCPPSNHSWQLTADRVVINQLEDSGQAYHARLYLHDIPVLYLPYVSFPLSNKRKSGLLTPIYSHASNMGDTIGFPYYLNLAPNYDATITPSWSQLRGFNLDSEFRFLGPQLSGEVRINITPDDSEFTAFKQNVLNNNPNNFAATDARVKAVSRASSRRASLAARANAYLNQNWSAQAIFNGVTDDNYYQDLGVPLYQSDSRQLLRNLQLSYQDMHWSVLSELSDYQILQPYDSSIFTHPYHTVPRIKAIGSYPNILSGVDIAINGELANFEHRDDVITGNKVTTGLRTVLSPSISMPWQVPYAFLTPSIEFHNVFYNLNLGDTDSNNNKPSTTSKHIPIISLDSGMIFERDWHMHGNNMLQTLEPRIYYLFVPFTNQNELPVFDSGLFSSNYDQLFRPNRFTSSDRIGDANQITVALGSRLLKSATGEQQAQFNIGQTYSFITHKVSLCDSDISPGCIANEQLWSNDRYSNVFEELSYQFHESWELSENAQWDPNDNTTRKFGARLKYQPAPMRAVTIGYQLDNTLEISSRQLESSVVWEFNPNFKLLGHWQYSLRDNLSIDLFGGIEYENCCWAVRLGKRRYLAINNDIAKKFENIIFLQFILKGLLSYGDNFSAEALTQIPDYKDTLGSHY